jgi:ATP-dependent Lon protease
MVQQGHLFAPMPDVIRDDMAFIDRMHYYLPGWEIPKMRPDLFTSHYGFVVDYFAEALRALRKHNFTETIDKHFNLGSHLNTRDQKAVRKTVSGLMKIIYPHGEVSKEELGKLVEFAIEGRRRVKEQLKKMGSFEYYQTSFSYSDRELGEEKFVGVPEQGGRDLVAADPLAPGSVYTGAIGADGTVGLYRLEVTITGGTGKLKTAGGVRGAMKESISRAFSYLLSKKVEFGMGREIDNSDFHVEAIDLLNNGVEAEVGVAFFVAAFSAPMMDANPSRKCFSEVPFRMVALSDPCRCLRLQIFICTHSSLNQSFRNFDRTVRGSTKDYCLRINQFTKFYCRQNRIKFSVVAMNLRCHSVKVWLIDKANIDTQVVLFG